MRKRRKIIVEDFGLFEQRKKFKHSPKSCKSLFTVRNPSPSKTPTTTTY
jgi:hypothetical protein